MGRKIDVDIDDLLAIFGTYGSGGPTPSDRFEIIGDCDLKDIDEYARTRGDDYRYVKEELIEMFKGYIGARTVAEMRERDGV